MFSATEIGFRIKERREQIGLTLEDIATHVGVARSTIQRYEVGSINRPKLPVLLSISQALRVNPDWLLGISDIMSQEEKEQPNDGLSAKRKELVDLVMDAPEDKLDMLLRVAKSIVEAE